MATVTSINPYTNKKFKAYTTHTSDAAIATLEKAQKRFTSWKETSFEERKKLMLNAASILKKNKETYALTITKEIGKPISQAISEIEKCAWVCEYYAENASQQLEDQNIHTDASSSYISYEPLGVLLAIMPWNYPFWQVFRFAAPSLMAGNVAVLKHASNVFGSALNIEAVFKEAGFPSHCFTTLLIKSDVVTTLIENPIIKAVTLTGSGPAGSAVAATAGKNIKKTVLELGGSNAMIVLDDCDLDKTISTVVQARFQNTGQSCIAGKRLLVQNSIAEVFSEKLLKQTKQLKSGDPTHPEVYIGTMAREDLAKELEDQVNASVKQGAKIILGGNRTNAYFEPTILTNVTKDMPVFKEETFGPVLPVLTFETLQEAIELSNNSKFGLGVSVFTSDIEKIKPHIKSFNEGAVFINEMVKSDPRLPFGGIKESGYGRELSHFGIQEFVNKKTVYIK